MRRLLLARVVLFPLAAWSVWGQANGKLQIHFMDVGQGDGAVVVSPLGEVALFDAGEDMKRKGCTKPLSYLDQLGVTKVDYVIVSHYHSDHIGCIPAVLQKFPLSNDALDRGGNYPSAAYTNYLAAVSGHRKTALPGNTVVLDANGPNPVVITLVAVNGAGVQTTNENDLSLATVVAYGNFRAEISGDLSGDNTSNYKDIETPVAPAVGPIDVYKVHHHCSSHSTNDLWLETTKPAIGIVSTGDGNDYHHPTQDCLERLHKHGVKTYWTETGNGADPESGWDAVAGNVVVEVDPGATIYTVRYGPSGQDVYSIAGAPGPPPITPPPNPSALPKYAWSQKSGVYHFINCQYVANISPQNLQKGDTPPAGKNLHNNCPTGGTN